MPVLLIQPLGAAPCKGVLASLYPLTGGGSNPSRLNTAAASGDSKYLSSSVEGPLSFASLLTPAEKTVVTLISGGSGPRISTPSIDMSSGFCLIASSASPLATSLPAKLSAGNLAFFLSCSANPIFSASWVRNTPERPPPAGSG